MKVINNEPYLEECLISIDILAYKLGHLQQTYTSGNKFTFALELEDLSKTALLEGSYLPEILSKEDLKIIHDKSDDRLKAFIRAHDKNQDKK